VAAEIALAESDGAGAIHELDAIPVPDAADLAQNYWYIRGEAPSSPAIRWKGPRPSSNASASFGPRGPARESRRTLREDPCRRGTRRAAESAAEIRPIVAGWLQLGPVALEMERNPMHGAAALGTGGVCPAAPRQRQRADGGTESQSRRDSHRVPEPNRLAPAALRPSRSRGRGRARRLHLGYLEQDAATRPRLRVYDVAAETVAGAYQHAMQDGAGFVVGPLTKEDVAALAPLSAGRVPVLALNFLADSVNPTARLLSIRAIARG
jgi:hypothetical protein